MPLSQSDQNGLNGPAVHLLGSLEVGGMQRGTLQLIGRARQEGRDDRLVVFDAPPRGEPDQYDRGHVPVDYIPRRPGLDLRFPRLVAEYVSRHEMRIIHTHNHSALFYGCWRDAAWIHARRHA